MKLPRLLMADDHSLVIEGMRKLVEDDCELVGTVHDGRALLVTAELTRPDIVLMDVSMPLLNGIEACRQLLKSLPKTRVIFLTMHAGVSYVEEAFRAGAVGYLLKRSAATELGNAIRMAMRGGRYLTPLIDKKALPASRLLDDYEKSSERLTYRQREVLQLVAEGRANKTIAALLHVSEKTVDYHKASIKRALTLRSTAELTQYAIEHHIVGSQP